MVPSLPWEIILLILESPVLVLPLFQGPVAYPSNHFTTRTLLSLCLASKAISKEASKKLYGRCCKIDSLKRLELICRTLEEEEKEGTGHEKKVAVVEVEVAKKNAGDQQDDEDEENQFQKTITQPLSTFKKGHLITALVLFPIGHDLLSLLPKHTYHIPLLLSSCRSSLRRFLLNLPLRSLYPRDDTTRFKSILRKAFLELETVEEFCSVRDELFLATKEPWRSDDSDIDDSDDDDDDDESSSEVSSLDSGSTRQSSPEENDGDDSNSLNPTTPASPRYNFFQRRREIEESEPQVWTCWPKLRRLCLYNVSMDNFFVAALRRREDTLEELVLGTLDFDETEVADENVNNNTIFQSTSQQQRQKLSPLSKIAVGTERSVLRRVTFINLEDGVWVETRLKGCVSQACKSAKRIQLNREKEWVRFGDNDHKDEKKETSIMPELRVMILPQPSKEDGNGWLAPILGEYFEDGSLWDRIEEIKPEESESL